MPERRGSARRAATSLTLAVAASLVASPAGAEVEVPAPVRFEALDDAPLTLGDGRRFLDTLEVRAGGGGLQLVNELALDDYVAGIAEMPSHWPIEALKAQAVAARTYAWHSILLASFDGYDICATVACQVFRGADVELDDPSGHRWREAVDATSGEVLLDAQGGPILARYFSTSGGRTYANEEAFPSSGPRPYLVAIDDPYDRASPLHRWTARFTRDEWDAIAARGDTVSAATPVADVQRLGPTDDPAATIRVTGVDGTVVEVGARDLATFVSRFAVELFPERFPGPRADGLRPLPSAVPSSRFAPEVTDDEVILHGQGWGHGVGMGQYGALGRARDGATYDEILAAYYDGLRPTQAEGVPDRVRVGLDTVGEASVTGGGPVRIVAGDEVVAARTLGRWSIAAGPDGLQLTPPPGDGEPLEVSATRVADGVQLEDAAVVEVEVNKPVLLSLEVSDADGEPVLRRDLGVADAGVHAATWHFGGRQGVAPGTYRVVLRAEDADGARGGRALTVEVPAEPVAGAVPAPAGGAPRGPGGRPRAAPATRRGRRRRTLRPAPGARGGRAGRCRARAGRGPPHRDEEPNVTVPPPPPQDPPSGVPGPPPGPPPGGPPPAGPPPAGPPPGPGGQPDRPFADRVDLRDRSAAGAFRVPFSVFDGFAALLAYFVGQLLAGLAAGIGIAVTGGAIEDAPIMLIGLAGQAVGIALALAYLLARRRLDWRLLGPTRPRGMTVAVGLAAGIAGTIGAYALNAALVTLVGTDDPVEQEVLQDVLAGGRTTVLAVLVAVVMAPVVEEVIFRGVLFQALRRRVGLWPAALLSSLVFTVIHVEIVFSQPVALAGLFVLGVWFAWTFHRTGSLVVPVLGHAVFNGLSVLLAIAAERMGELV